MKKIIILVVVFINSAVVFAQSVSESSLLKGMNVGVGIPVECHDLKAAGSNLHLGFDYTGHVSDNFALGFYLSAGGGFLGAFKPYNEYDKFYGVFKLSAGLLMEFGDMNNKPYILGIAPCTGIGYVDMDLVLPVEVRFGRLFSNNWYVMGGFSYGISLAKETRSFEPSIHIGYNFGHKAK